MSDPQVPQFYSDPSQIVLHPTDFSPEAEMAFAHALRIALANKASLSLLHVGENDEGSFPSIRDTLERWGLLPPGAKRSEVGKLGIRVEKVLAAGDDVPEAIAGFLIDRPVDLLVLSSQGRSGLASWLRPSRAEAAARKTGVPTLFVPSDGRGCVSVEDGTVTLNQILIPVDHDPPCESAIERGLRALQAHGTEDSRLILLHIGSAESFPQVDLPQGSWKVERVVRDGSPVAEILDACDEFDADAMIMVTQGTHGYLDALRGTTTEQVLRACPCPLLAIPADF